MLPTGLPSFDHYRPVALWLEILLACQIPPDLAPLKSCSQPRRAPKACWHVTLCAGQLSVGRPFCAPDWLVVWSNFLPDPSFSGRPATSEPGVAAPLFALSRPAMACCRVHINGAFSPNL